MKKIKFLTLLFLVTSYLYPAAQQVWLPNDVWSLSAYKGIYSGGSSGAKSWDDEPHSVIEDIADSDVTYLITNNAFDDHLYNTSTPSSSMDITNNLSTEIGATIGIFAIRGGKSLSGSTTLDGTEASTVKMKFTTFKTKKLNDPIYSMYVAGSSNRPAIRIFFQGNYQGDKFRVKFGNEKTAYIGYFDYRNTFDSPATLKDEATDAGSNTATTVDIRNVFDFNITDNNITKMIKNTFSLSAGVDKINSGAGDSLIVHHYNTNGIWQVYNSANTNSNSNAFSKIEVGKAYWMKANSQLAHNDSNFTKLGFITSSNSQLKKDYLSKLANGWNLLMFEESHIRYATSGVVMRDINFSNTTFWLSKPSGIGTRIDNNISVDNVGAAGGAANFLNRSVRAFNASVAALNVLNGTSKRIRAFPASTRAGARSVAILSDDIIYMSSRIGTSIAANIATLAGEPIITLNEPDHAGNEAYASRLGEYILVAKLNDINGSEINGTININTPTISSTAGVATDLNATSKGDRATAIFNALRTSSTKSSGQEATNFDVLLIHVDDMNTTLAYSTTTTVLVNQMNSVLIASGERFSISDNTYTKAYKYKRNGDFRIVGSSSKDITMNNAPNNISALEAAFDNVQADTKVDFHDLGLDSDGDRYFAISSNSASNIDLLENESNGTTLFEEISLGSTVIPEVNRTYMQGAMGEVYTIDNLLSARIDFNDTSILDGNGSLGTERIGVRVASGSLSGITKEDTPYIIGDLKTNVIWALDFPMNNLVEKLADNNKRLDVLLTADTTSTGSIIWRATDLTKPPQDWYGNSYDSNNLYNNDYQGIFRTSPNKAYWAKISDINKITGSITSNSVLSTNTTPHFDNEVDSVSNPVSPTYNDINHKLVVYLNQNFINPLTNSFYDVIAMIDGKRYHLRSSGSNFQLNIKNKEMNLKQRGKGEQPYPILIEAHDGLGNVLAESINNNKFDIDFVKPSVSKISWNEIGELVVTNRGSLDIQAYAGYISDIQSVRDLAKMDFNDSDFITRFPDNVGWDRDTSSTDEDGLPVLLKIISMNKITKMYSDALTTMYAPLKFGHVLEVNETDADNIDNIPYSFMQKQYLTKQGVNSNTKVLFNGTNGINGGVQLNKQQQAIASGNKKIKLVYYPSGGAKKESSNEISRFGGDHTMYLKVNDSDSNPIASIVYISDMAGAVFYIEYDGQLYMGRFTDNDNYNNDANSYILKDTDTFNVTSLQNSSTYSLATSGRHLNFGSSTPVQMIFNGIPPKDFNNQGAPTNTGGGNNNTGGGNTGGGGNNNAGGGGGNTGGGGNNNAGGGGGGPPLPTP